MPITGDIGAVPVPGCVDGWLALHERFARLPLEVLLEPARRCAGEGFSASIALAQASRLLRGMPGAEEFGSGGDGVRPGERIRRPGVARGLAAIAADGRRGFYEGEFREALLALGAGEFTADDLSRRQADWVEALGVDAFDQRLLDASAELAGLRSPARGGGRVRTDAA